MSLDVTLIVVHYVRSHILIRELSRLLLTLKNLKMFFEDHVKLFYPTLITMDFFSENIFLRIFHYFDEFLIKSRVKPDRSILKYTCRRGWKYRRVG